MSEALKDWVGVGFPTEHIELNKRIDMKVDISSSENVWL